MFMVPAPSVWRCLGGETNSRVRPGASATPKPKNFPRGGVRAAVHAVRPARILKIMAVTPARSIRVSDELWARFGEAAALVGSNRNRMLAAFMTRFADAMATPPAWIADQASQMIATTFNEDELPTKKVR